jgi:hypothetical protein
LNQLSGFSSFFGPVRFTSAQLVSSHSFPLPGVASPPTDVATPSFHVTLPSHRTKMSSLPLLHLSVTRLPSRAKTEALNLHRHHRPPSPDSLTPILYCYNKVISTLATLSTTQPHLHFAFSLARAPRPRSSTHHRHSLSPPPHVYHLFTHWHPQ